MRPGSKPPRTPQDDLSCIAVELSSRALQGYATALGIPPPQALAALASALAATLDVPEAPSSLTLVVRGGEAPAFAWIGSFDRFLQNCIETQARALESTCAHLRYVGYPAAEAACRRLAASLVSRLGREELARTRFVAIPNGGFVILGLLASILGLSRRQLDAREESDSLLVIVDDCAISGARFREILGTCRGRVVFAPLYSPQPLRAAIQATEDRVIDCLSGEDLREIPARPSAEHQERRRQRIERGECYWIGSTEPLCFPWNEPDRTLWNASTQRHERAWRIVPSELCLKNHPAPGRRPIPVQAQPEARGPLRPSRQALFAEISGEIAVCSFHDGQVFRLGDTGSALWRGVVTGGSLNAAIDAVASQFDVPEAVLSADARRFVESLLARGLLTDAGC